MQFYTLPDNYASEIDDFERLIENYNKGEVSELQLKIYRVPFGVYEQREKGTFMVRIRCSAGGITPIQLRKVAELSQKYGNKELHVTTRQEVQIHDAKLSDVIAIIRGLKEVELSSRGGGGNTLRNVMASYDSGLQEDDIFDVTPYATLLTDKFIERPDTWKLPRKFKITFSSSLRNNSNVHINDVGFQAMMKDGKRGFKVYVAGGMGAKPKLAEVLEEFVLDEDIFLVAEAVKQVFSKYGNRKNKT